MRLADNALKSVAFIATQHPETGADVYGATGFFVKHIDDEGNGDSYFVTAKHAARQIEGSSFKIRIGDTVITFDSVQWYYSQDASVDVAVTRYLPLPVFGAVRFPTKHFLTEFKIGSKRIGPGDQASIVGLYRLHPGKQKNRPIVHTGHIAMMPDKNERLGVRNWPESVEGYLIEAQTLDGLSGSPVYVRRSIKVKAIERTGTQPLAYGAVFLLGLWMASWSGIPDDEIKKEVEKKVKQNNRPVRDIALKVPIGMGIVVPAYKILEILDMPELKKIRREIAAKKDQENAADLASVLPTRGGEPQHKERFNRLLNAAVKSPKSGGRT